MKVSEIITTLWSPTTSPSIRQFSLHKLQSATTPVLFPIIKKVAAFMMTSIRQFVHQESLE